MAGRTNERKGSWCLWALLVLLLLLVVNSGVNLFYVQEDAKEYRRLWMQERSAHRATIINHRVTRIERQTNRAFVEHRENPYEERLALLRRRFAGLLQPEPKAPACPKAAVVPPAPATAATAGADDPAGAERADDAGVSAAEHRRVRDRLRGLQTWVKEHIAAYHGVTM